MLTGQCAVSFAILDRLLSGKTCFRSRTHDVPFVALMGACGWASPATAVSCHVVLWDGTVVMPADNPTSMTRRFRFCRFVRRARGTTWYAQPDDPAQSEAFELFV